MAKIRGVKPEFWTDERVVEVSRDARLLFIGMWNFACDNGHLDDKPKQLKMKIFPGDDDTDLEAWLGELVKAGRIVRDGTTITIPKFAEHQKPHKRWWATCDLPSCVVPEGAPPQGRNGVATVAATVAHGGATADGDGEGEFDCEFEGEGEKAAASQPPTPSGKRRRPSRPIPDSWSPNEKHQQLANERGLDLNYEAMRFRNNALSKDRRQANWDFAFRNWLTSDYAKPRPAQQNRGQMPEGW